VVVGFSGIRPVAIGTGFAFGLTRATHGSVDIDMVSSVNSFCFNGVLDQGERDVDCGGSDCPACAPGLKCLFSSEDCANSTCLEDADMVWRCH
jgi:hypothetical protein